MASEAKSDHFANVAQSKSLDCWKVIFAFLQYCTLVAISQNNAALWNIVFELGADFGHLLFESYLVIEWTNLNRTKWITWPMSWHNFHVLWTNLVKCAHRSWCHQMYRIFIRGDKTPTSLPKIPTCNFTVESFGLYIEGQVSYIGT